ncbi:hypothetical protein AX14_007959 [Amanita brunnescens Koide BX004]|nr:hypothetical protein AX14_007959 [Amanita brunnescens Koide BX004]
MTCDAWVAGMNARFADFIFIVISLTTLSIVIAGFTSELLMLKNSVTDIMIVVFSCRATAYGGNCTFWDDSTQWNETIKAGVLQFGMASMDALGDHFFCTWEVGHSSGILVVLQVRS